MKTLTAWAAILVTAGLFAACGTPDGSTEAGGDPGNATAVPGTTPSDPDSPTNDDPYSRGDCPGDPSTDQDPDEPVMRKPCPNQKTPGGARYELAEPYDGPVEGARPMTWERVRAKGSDDRTFLFLYWSGVEPCNVLDRVEVDEGADEVVVTIFEGTAGDQQNVVCIEIGVHKAVEITLEEPLGDRELVDGAD